MIILLHGADSFRSREKLREIIQEYQVKHQSGLNLLRFNQPNINNIREAVEMVSMFDEKKLLILENVLENKTFLEDFFVYAKQNKLKNNQDVILVFYQSDKIAVSKFKNQLTMHQEFKQLFGWQLTDWAKKQTQKYKGEIDNLAINKLISLIGQDLWQIDSEIQKLIAFKGGEKIQSADIDQMVKAKASVNIFKTLDALAAKDKKTALRLLHQHLEQGENEIYLLSMLVYQIRILLRLKDLFDRGTSYADLAKLTKLHPYVIKKNSSQLKNFSLAQLKSLYFHLMDLDLKIKTGRIDGLTGLDLLIGEI